MTDAHLGPSDGFESSVPRRLLGAGVLATAGGLLGGLVAKWFADEASRRASSATRLMTDPSNPIGLIIDPTSVHQVAPDYTVFWIGMTVAAIGIVALLLGALASRRRTSTRLR